MAPLATMAIRHLWMGQAFKPYLGLVLWATVAAAGFLVVDQVFTVWPTTSPPAWLLAIVAGVFALIDWAESTQNFTIAARGESPPRRAFLDSIYWTRALGVVLFLFGAVGVLVRLATIGAGTTSLAEALRASAVVVFYWVIISLGAGLGVGLGVVLNHFYARSSSPPARIVILAAVIGPLISTAVILLATVVVYEVWRFAARHSTSTYRQARRSRGRAICGAVAAAATRADLLRQRDVVGGQADDPRLSWLDRPPPTEHITSQGPGVPGSLVFDAQRPASAQIVRDAACGQSCGRRCTATSSVSFRSIPSSLHLDCGSVHGSSGGCG